MKKAINGWAFPKEMDLNQVLAAARDAGFDGYEACMSEDGFLRLGSWREDSESIRQAAGETGLEVPSIASGLNWKYPLSSPDDKVAEKGLQVVRESLQAANLLGAKAVLVVPGVVTEDVPYSYAYARSMENLKKVMPLAEDLGVDVGVENVWNKFLLSPLEFKKFLEELGSERAKAYFDVGNVLVNGYPQDWIRTLGEYVSCVHVKDFKTEVGNIRGFTYLLQGDVNWPEVMKAFTEVGYDYYLVAELGPFKFFPTKMLYDTSSSLDRIISLAK